MGTLISKSDVKRSDRPGYYVVQKHNVSLGKPYCDCYQWEHCCFPCQHMFAAILHDNLNFEDALPADYLKLPYLNLDMDVVSELGISEPEITVATSAPSPEAPIDLFSSEEEVLQMSQSSIIQAEKKETEVISLQCRLREQTKRLTSLSYTNFNENSLRALVSCLENEISKAERLVKKDKHTSLPTRRDLNRKRKLLKSTQLSQKYWKRCRLIKLPKARKRHPFTNRAGEKAEVMRNLYQVKPTILNRGRELVAASYKKRNAKSTVSNFKAGFQTLINQAMCERILQPTYWLDDNDINFCLELLGKQHSTQIQDVVLGSVLRFKATEGDFVQILHDRVCIGLFSSSYLWCSIVLVSFKLVHF